MTTLVESVAPPAGRTATRVAFASAAVIAGSLLIAGLAQLSIHLPFTPVPITGQTLGVLLVGASLGAVLGAASVGLYLLEGAVGLPFFAAGESGVDVLLLGSATGGYLWGFVLAAAVVGLLSRRGWDRTIGSSIGAMFVGQVVIYACGIPWLMAAVGADLEQAVVMGLAPFVPGDAFKILLAAGALPAAWRLLRTGERAE